MLVTKTTPTFADARKSHIRFRKILVEQSVNIANFIPFPSVNSRYVQGAQL